MKRFLAFLLICLLCFGSAGALEITDEDFEYWREEMRWLVEEIGLRKVGTSGEGRACDYLRAKFESLGFSYDDETLYESLSYLDYLLDDRISLIAVKPALTEEPQIITVTAHYDSLGPGARDNASGVAAMLMLARLFSAMPAYEDTELRFIAFSAEESGHQGSIAYCEEISYSEWERSFATFNIDILVADTWEAGRAFSLDTMGMRTEDGYEIGSLESPAYNRPALAMLAAMEELGVYPAEAEEVTWCGPRHLGMSDHESFHIYEMDSVNVCFRGTTASGGEWPQIMHVPEDVIGDFDWEASRNALNALYTAIDSLARDHGYGL